jgi:hypothetical protein
VWQQHAARAACRRGGPGPAAPLPPCPCPAARRPPPAAHRRRSGAQLQEAAAQLVRLRTRQGATGALLAGLAAAAGDLLDAEYCEHARLLAALGQRQAAACEALLHLHLPYLQAASELNARFPEQQQQQQQRGQQQQQQRGQQEEQGDGGGGGGQGPGGCAREAALARLPLVEPAAFDAERLAAAQWRYPPERFVVWPVKGMGRREGGGPAAGMAPEPGARPRPAPPAQLRAGPAGSGQRQRQGVRGLFD